MTNWNSATMLYSLSCARHKPNRMQFSSPGALPYLFINSMFITHPPLTSRHIMFQACQPCSFAELKLRLECQLNCKGMCHNNGSLSFVSRWVHWLNHQTHASEIVFPVSQKDICRKQNCHQSILVVSFSVKFFIILKFVTITLWDSTQIKHALLTNRELRNKNNFLRVFKFWEILSWIKLTNMAFDRNLFCFYKDKQYSLSESY